MVTVLAAAAVLTYGWVAVVGLAVVVVAVVGAGFWAHRRTRAAWQTAHHHWHTDLAWSGAHPDNDPAVITLTDAPPGVICWGCQNADAVRAIGVNGHLVPACGPCAATALHRLSTGTGTGDGTAHGGGDR